MLAKYIVFKYDHMSKGGWVGGAIVQIRVSEEELLRDVELGDWGGDDEDNEWWRSWW